MEYWKILRENIGQKQVIIPGADGAIIKDNKILLIKNKAIKRWFIPGGLQDLNESVTDTVEREIKEELNLDLKVDYLISVYSSRKWIKKYPNGDINQALTFFFKMRGDIDVSKIKIDEDEVSDYDFFKFDNLPQDTELYSRLMCEDYIKFKNKVFFR